MIRRLHHENQVLNYNGKKEDACSGVSSDCCASKFPRSELKGWTLVELSELGKDRQQDESRSARSVHHARIATSHGIRGADTKATVSYWQAKALMGATVRWAV